LGYSERDRRQLNVRLPLELVLRVKHAAIDVGESQQDFIERAVNERLHRLRTPAREVRRKAAR
jgi:predicted DNA binding CopG/RHH family protein